MATYALTFATRAAFDTSLASGDIYNLMQGVTSSKPSVAITATIMESGETFACGTNVMVDIKSVGPGDYVMYDSTNDKFFGIASKWIDNNYPNQPTQHIMIFKAGVLPSRYVVCGTVIKRFGNRIRLAGSRNALPWSTTSTTGYDWDVPNIPNSTLVLKKNGERVNIFNTNQWCSFLSSRHQESFFAGGDATYLPIDRQTWDSAVASGADTVTQNNKTATLADYNNSYDKWLAENWQPKYPAARGAFFDTNGFSHTRKIVAAFIANHGKTAVSEDYAAGYCYNYTPSNSVPGLQKHSWFLGVLKDVMEVKAVSHTLLQPAAWGSYNIWSSSQQAASVGWYVGSEGSSRYTAKYRAYVVIPLADLILEN